MSLGKAWFAGILTLALAGTAHSQGAPVEIQWWHAMGGQLGEKVGQIADGFNKSQSQYKVVPVYKGTYTETLTRSEEHV